MSLAKTSTVTALCPREAPIEQSVFSTTSFHCRSSEFPPAGAHNQAAVVQRLDSVLQWSNHYLVDTLMNFDNTNPLVNVSNLDSSIEQIEPRVYNSRTALMSQCFSDQSMTAGQICSTPCHGLLRLAKIFLGFMGADLLSVSLDCILKSFFPFYSDIPTVGSYIQKPFRIALEKQKEKLHRKPGQGASFTTVIQKLTRSGSELTLHSIIFVPFSSSGAKHPGLDIREGCDCYDNIFSVVDNQFNGPALC